jgi:ubiquinone/menaquinone biosynthesis C-methylase UbiE
MSYEALARVYDGFFERDYDEKILRRYRRILTDADAIGGRILDMGCGTGRLAIALARGGAMVCGVDPDEAMLACAQEKGIGLSIEWICGTLPQVEGSSRFDAITASLDVVNHITDKEALQESFCAAYRLLDKGGCLVFDVNTEKKFREVYGQNAYVFRALGAFAAWENDYDEDEEICQFTVDVFTQAGDRYERKTDIIYERMYRDADLRRMLKAAGFRIILQQGMDHGTRHLYIAKK